MSARADVQPWQMTREQWNAERMRLRPCFAQSNFTKGSASEACARADRLAWLLFGVRDDDRAALNDLGLSSAERLEAFDRLQTPVSYDDVIARAARIGLLSTAEAEAAA